MKKGCRLLFAFTIAVICWLFFSVTGKLYLRPDNLGIAIVINGLFGSPMSQYQHPLFCLLINLLSRVFQSADALTLSVHLMIIAELTVIEIILMDATTRKPPRDWKIPDYIRIMLSILAVFFLSAGLKVWNANYTIQAASFVLSGWITLIYALREKKGTIWIITGTVFAALGYMLRKEAGMLFIPFVGLILISEFVADKQCDNQKQRFIKYVLPCCVIIFLLFASQTIYNAIEPNATAERYNGARTTMVDFPINVWDDSFGGVSKTDYIAVSNWMLADTENINADSLEALAAVAGSYRYPFNMRGLGRALSDMWEILWKTDVHITVLALLGILTGLFNTLTQHGAWRKLAAICGPIGTFIIMLYFTFRGRALMNVWVSVLLALMCLEVVLLTRDDVSDKIRTAFSLVLCVCLYYSAGQAFAHAEFHEIKTVLNSRVNADESAFEATAHEDDLYIWPNTMIFRTYGPMEKLPSQQFLEHNVSIGDWSSGQPYYTAFLEHIGHPNPIRDLVEKDNVYIMDNSGYILNFLREHYGKDIELVAAGEVNGMTAYRVERGSEN